MIIIIIDIIPYANLHMLSGARHSVGHMLRTTTVVQVILVTHGNTAVSGLGRMLGRGSKYNVQVILSKFDSQIHCMFRQFKISVVLT